MAATQTFQRVRFLSGSRCRTTLAIPTKLSNRQRNNIRPIIIFITSSFAKVYQLIDISAHSFTRCRQSINAEHQVCCACFSSARTLFEIKSCVYNVRIHTGYTHGPRKPHHHRRQHNTVSDTHDVVDMFCVHRNRTSPGPSTLGFHTFGHQHNQHGQLKANSSSTPTISV